MTHDPVIEPEAPELRAGDIFFLDARSGPDARARYLAEHIAGAQHIDLETDLSEVGPNAADGGRHPLPTAGAFAAILARLGVSPETPVVVYDDKGGQNAAARCWWMLRAVGHRSARVLNGGLDAARAAGLPMAVGEEARPDGAAYEADSYLLSTVDREGAAAAATDRSWLLVDVRGPARYRGEEEPIDPVAGHIPGAINIPLAENLDEAGRILPADELRRRYDARLGGVPPERVVFSCGSGVTACHGLLAMERAGLHGAALYVGSFSEWSRGHAIARTAEGADPIHVARALIDAIERGDVDAVGALYHDDAEVHMNTSPRPLDRARMLGVIRFLATRVQDLRYEDITLQPTPTGFVQQHTLTCTAPGGESVRARACLVACVDAGRIRRLDEYLDAAAIAALS